MTQILAAEDAPTRGRCALPLAVDHTLAYPPSWRIACGMVPFQPAQHMGASVSSPTIDCTSCGACCFGGHDRYVALMPEDQARPIPESTTTEIAGRRYMTMVCGHCAQLTMTPEGLTLCAIYEGRPEACRAFRVGSFECLKARQYRGPEAEALRAFAMAQRPTAPLVAEVVPLVLVGQGADMPPADTLSPSP